MSAPDRSPPANPRPVRRRRVTQDTLLPGPRRRSMRISSHPSTEDTMNLTATTSRSSHQSRASETLTAWSNRMVRASGSILSPFCGSGSENNLQPLIPMDAILSPETETPSMDRSRSDLEPYVVESFDLNEHMMDLNDITTSRFLLSNLLARGSPRSRAAAGRHRLERNRAASATPVKPPHALLMYTTERSDSEISLYNQPLVSASATRYLPLVPAPPRIGNDSTKYRIQPSHQQRMDQVSVAAPCRAQWLPGEMPVELFESITQHLSRDDIKSMRLVNKEFERGVSNSLFRTVVVPFNTELYDMIEQDNSAKRDFKGKRRADDPNNTFVDIERGSLQWKNAMEDKEDKVYRGHGLRVFEGFGNHIRRFGMSFEIKEDALHDPPFKKVLDHLQSYFGSYQWPSQEYTRFDKLAGLEKTADETSLMKLAFSHLKSVNSLALSMDSGLGWMTGPDKSMRSQILQRAPHVFGCSHAAVDTHQQERAHLWESLERAYRNADALDELKQGYLKRGELQSTIANLEGLAGTIYNQPGLWSGVDTGVITDVASSSCTEEQTEVSPTGVLYVQSQESETSPYDSSLPPDCASKEIEKRSLVKPTFNPAALDKHQKEWLLEAEWAQRAFLMSYMLAVVDNNNIFSRITVLNLARISSRLVPLFQRDDFWDALPYLADVTLGVIPDWRTVERDEAGFVETREINPSKAHDVSYTFIQQQLGPRSSIKKLKFGWTAGGEHAEGTFARNHHILPAPVNALPHSVQSLENDDTIISLPYVEHLVLSNCWITPTSLVNLVKSLEKASLQTITLDSVSLTAHPRNLLANANANANLNQNQNQHALFAAAVGAMVAQAGLPAAPLPAAAAQPVVPPAAAQNFGHLFWQGPPAGVPHGPWASTMLHQMHWMMTQNGIQYNQLGQMWSNHPAGMTLGQMAQALGQIAAGGLQAGMQAVGGIQPFAGAPPGGIGGLAPPAGLGAQNPFLQLPAPVMGAGPIANSQVIDNGNQQWYEGHRAGSWVDVLNALSPGKSLELFRTRDEFDPPVEPRDTHLVKIELVSCGYAQLQQAPFDQSMLEEPAGHHTFSPYFHRRRTILAPYMLSTIDRYLGHIVQHMSEREQYALMFAWDMRLGWQDEKMAEEPEYDGYLPGGTGRFSGTVTNDMTVGPAGHQN